MGHFIRDCPRKTSLKPNSNIKAASLNAFESSKNEMCEAESELENSEIDQTKDMSAATCIVRSPMSGPCIDVKQTKIEKPHDLIKE